MMTMGDGTKISMKTIKDAITDPFNRHLYILQRYDIKVSMAFVYTPADVHYLPKRIRENVRNSDEIVQLHDELFAVFFSHVDYSGAHRACQKLIHNLSQSHKPVHASIMEIFINESAHSLIQKNMHLLAEVKDNSEPSLEDIIAYESIH